MLLIYKWDGLQFPTVTLLFSETGERVTEFRPIVQGCTANKGRRWNSNSGSLDSRVLNSNKNMPLPLLEIHTCVFVNVPVFEHNLSGL